MNFSFKNFNCFKFSKNSKDILIPIESPIKSSILNPLPFPDEIIVLILNELNIVQQFKCRLISKRFKFIVDYLLLDIKEKLNIFQLGSLTYAYHPSTPKIDIKNSIYDNHLYFHLDLKLILSSNFFINLKELFVHFYYPELNLEILNKFEKLEILYFSSLEPQYTDNDYIIKLPNLKYFAINSDYKGSYRWKYKIIIESKLEEIWLTPLYNKFIIKYPETIISLTTDCEILLSKLKNIKTLRYGGKIDSKFFEKLKKLTKLETIYINSNLNEEQIIDFNLNLIKLLDSKILKNIKKIYFWDIEFVFGKKIQYACMFGCLDILKSQLINYNLLTESAPFKSLTFQYDVLINCLIGKFNLFKDLEKNKLLPELPIDFFIKFNNINCVNVNKIRLDDRFIIFLKNCNILSYLSISECRLTQSLLNQLPSASNFMYTLILKNLFELDYKKINFDFVLNFKYIGYLKTNQIDIYVAAKLLNDSKSLSTLDFEYLQNKFDLTKFNVKECIEEDFDFIWFHSGYNKKISEELMKLNKEFDELFKVKYFDGDISRFGLNYDQLLNFIQDLPNLTRGKSLEAEYNFNS